MGEVSIHFCASDWSLITDLVLDMGLSPLSRCNAAKASLDVREDFEALLNDVREEPDQTDLESRMIAKSRQVLAEYDAESNHEERDLVEAKVRLWALADAGVVSVDAADS